MKPEIKFEDDFTDEEFVEYLFHSVLKYKPARNEITILFSDCNTIARDLLRRLSELDQLQWRYYALTPGFDSSLPTEPVACYKTLGELKVEMKHGIIDLVVCASTLSKEIHAFFRDIQRYPELSGLPFIYKVRGKETYPVLDEQDQWKEFGIADTHVYITNQFDDGLFESIYRHSLTKVRRKCQIRDAYDLFQCLKQCECINGDIVEFGTFEGHSGLLMAEYIQRRKLNKRLYLCDTFDKFPEVNYGVDCSWSNLNVKRSDFARVKSIFLPYGFVELVKGEFENTLHHIPCDQLSLAFVDCDSYVATRFVSDYVYPRLSVGGCMVFEDYGHHALLGARCAVDEFLEEKHDSFFSFFSFFSGLKVAVRLK